MTDDSRLYADEPKWWGIMKDRTAQTPNWTDAVVDLASHIARVGRSDGFPVDDGRIHKAFKALSEIAGTDLELAPPDVNPDCPSDGYATAS